jgi:ketosteroid isomerase-like protein
MLDTYRQPPRFTTDRLIAEGDSVVALGQIELPDASGRPVHYEYCDVWQLRDGKLAGLRAFVVEMKRGG